MSPAPAPKATLVWTRSRADWPDDHAYLASLGFPSRITLLHLPCLTVLPRLVAVPTTTVTHVVFTSSNAVDQALQNGALAAVVRQASAVYTHGRATAERLMSHGLGPVLVDSARTAAELAAWLGRHVAKPAVFAWPTAAEPAFDLASALNAQGFRALRLVCYETRARALDATGRELQPAEIDRLTQTLSGAVCFASPSAVQGFAAVLKPAGTRLRDALVTVAIGPTTAEAARAHFAQVIVAADNSLEALAGAAKALLGA